MAIGLTQRERDCLDAIERLTVDGVAPSYMDLRSALGLVSNSGIHRLIKALELRGHIRRIPHRARSIEVVRTNASDLSAKLTSELLQMRARIDAELVSRS